MYKPKYDKHDKLILSVIGIATIYLIISIFTLCYANDTFKPANPKPLTKSIVTMIKE